MNWPGNLKKFYFNYFQIAAPNRKVTPIPAKTCATKHCQIQVRPMLHTIPRSTSMTALPRQLHGTMRSLFDTKKLFDIPKHRVLTCIFSSPAGSQVLGKRHLKLAKHAEKFSDGFFDTVKTATECYVKWLSDMTGSRHKTSVTGMNPASCNSNRLYLLF